jgi:hypothetical protein
LGRKQNSLHPGRLEQAVAGKVVCAHVAFVENIRLVVAVAANIAERPVLAAVDYDNVLVEVSVVGTQREHTCSYAEVQLQHVVCAVGQVVADARNSAAAHLLEPWAAPGRNGAVAVAAAADKQTDIAAEFAALAGQPEHNSAVGKRTAVEWEQK